MIEKNVGTAELPAQSTEQADIKHPPLTTRVIIFCLLAFVLCILLSIAPLNRETGTQLLRHMPPTTVPTWVGSWIPADLGVTNNRAESASITNNIESLLITALEFVIYGLAVLLIYQQSGQSANAGMLRIIWLGTIVMGLLFAMTPALLSHDVISYANYGRLMVIYHVNPYFVPPSAYPHDVIYPYNDWPHTISAYGPFSLVVFALLTLISSPTLSGYILTIRLFSFAAYLLNTLLVTMTLRTMKRSPRTVAIGTLLYAWNPLVLLESCLSAHNDTFMLTCMLAGIFLSVRAEQRGFASPRSYLPPIIAFTLAALIKFTSFPLIILFMVLLARKTLLPSTTEQFEKRQPISLQWRPALRATVWAGIASGIVILLFYGPFWVGHRLRDIVNSFSEAPSVRSAENSILRAVTEWVKANGLPPHTSWTYMPLHVFSQHPIWNDINIAVVAVTLLAGSIWLWRNPAIRTMALVTLGTLGAWLVVTPWFYPWYVTWLVGLVVICLPVMHERLGRALIAFTVTFSASAFFTYYYNVHPPLRTWSGFDSITIIAPPLLAFLFFFFFGWHSRGQVGEKVV